MSLTRQFGRPLALVILTLLAACSDPVGPLRPGTYVLRSIDGQSVPFSRTLVGGEILTEIADTLWFRADGSASQVTVQRFVDASIGRNEVVRWTSAYRYSVSGATVELTYSPPPCFGSDLHSNRGSTMSSVEGQGEGGCSYVQPVGTLTRDGLELGHAGLTEGRRMFVRVGD